MMRRDRVDLQLLGRGSYEVVFPLKMMTQRKKTSFFSSFYSPDVGPGLDGSWAGGWNQWVMT